MPYDRCRVMNRKDESLRLGRRKMMFRLTRVQSEGGWSDEEDSRVRMCVTGIKVMMTNAMKIVQASLSSAPRRSLRLPTALGNLTVTVGKLKREGQTE